MHGGQHSYFSFPFQDVDMLPGNVAAAGFGSDLGEPRSDWLAWLYPSPYTAAHRFGGVFMRVDVNDNFFENDVVCTMLLLKTEGGKYPFL